MAENDIEKRVSIPIADVNTNAQTIEEFERDLRAKAGQFGAEIPAENITEIVGVFADRLENPRNGLSISSGDASGVLAERLAKQRQIAARKAAFEKIKELGLSDKLDSRKTEASKSLPPEGQERRAKPKN